jgi:methionine aminopeptidase
MNLVGTIEIFLNETNSEVRIGENASESFLLERSETRRCFINIVLQRCIKYAVSKVEKYQEELGHISSWSVLTMLMYWVKT